MTFPSKLNIGCGGTRLPGYLNLDIQPGPSVDLVFDLETCAKGHCLTLGDGSQIPDNTFERMFMSHVFEHIHNVLPMMQELWRVAKPGCYLTIQTPYGSSDDADEDPTHVRRVFKETFTYFSQAWYDKNDYDYRGDWDFTYRGFYVYKRFEAPEREILNLINTARNVVFEFHAGLTAVKPARKPGFMPYKTDTHFRFI